MENNQMSYATSITTSGQTTLPKAIREFLNVRLGDKVTFTIRNDEVVIKRKLTPEEVAKELDDLKGSDFEESVKKYKGMSVSELKNTPESIKYYKEKYNV